MRLKVERWSLFVVALSAGLPAFAQPPLTAGTAVTGQRQGHESEPGCVLPNLFGSQGLTLTNTGAFPHYAHFIGPAQQTLNQTLSSAIATQLAVLPLISPVSPHVNFGYEWNGDSILAGNITGTTVSELNDIAVIQNGPATKG